MANFKIRCKLSFHYLKIALLQLFAQVFATASITM